MKRVAIFALVVLTVILTSVCISACNKSPYSLKNGAYNFEKAIITNKLTKVEMKKSFDDILNDKNDFKEWGNLLSFQILINDDTEYFRKKDNRYYVQNEGLAFEVVGNSHLQLHFPYWQGYDFNAYEVTIFLNWQQLYG